MVSGVMKKCGCPIRSPDGRKREHLSASVAAATLDQAEAWRQQRDEARPIARMGDVIDKLIEFGRVNGFDPVK
jgi:hypothetical protein